MTEKYVPGEPRKDGQGRFLDVSNRPVGIFGGVQGATPKYAKNVGEVNDDFRGTMARFFINVGENRRETVLEERLAELPKGYETFVPVVQAIYGNGYIDFLLQSVQTGLSEKLEVSDNLSDGYVAYYLGTSPQVLRCGGMLINSLQDDQVVSMVRLYAHILRGTKLADHGETVKLRFDSFLYSGYVNNIQWSLGAENELACPFSFDFLVKERIEIPSTYFKPVSLDDAPDVLGTVDTVGAALVPQKVEARMTSITTQAAKAASEPVTDAALEAARAQMRELLNVEAATPITSVTTPELNPPVRLGVARQ